MDTEEKDRMLLVLSSRRRYRLSNNYRIIHLAIRTLIIYTQTRSSYILNTPTKIILEVADTVKIAEKLGIKVDWNYRILGEIDKKNHFELMKQAQAWETQLLEFEEANKSSRVKLAELQANMITDGFNTSVINDHNIQVFKQ